MALRDFLNNMQERKDAIKELSEEVRIRKVVENRQKNSNERELERFMEEKRQGEIKGELEKFRENQKKEFLGHNLFKQDSIMRNGNNILRGQSMFSIKATNLNRGNLFFN